MTARFLGGVNTPFSNCFFVFTYRYSGGAGRGGGEPKFTSTQRTTIKNIHRNAIDADIIENQPFADEIRDRFNIRKAGNFSYGVTIDAEEMDISELNRAIQNTTRFINLDTDKNLQDVNVSALAGTNIRERAVKRRLQECDFSFEFLYSDAKGFNENFLRDNSIDLSTRNPAITQVINIPKGRVTEREFRLGVEGLNVEFGVDTDNLSPSDVRAINNAVDAFAERASLSRGLPEKRKNLIRVI